MKHTLTSCNTDRHHFVDRWRRKREGRRRWPFDRLTRECDRRTSSGCGHLRIFQLDRVYLDSCKVCAARVESSTVRINRTQADVRGTAPAVRNVDRRGRRNSSIRSRAAIPSWYLLRSARNSLSRDKTARWTLNSSDVAVIYCVLGRLNLLRTLLLNVDWFWAKFDCIARWRVISTIFSKWKDFSRSPPIHVHW